MTIEELKKERAIIRGLAVLNDDNLANEVIETNNVQNVLMFTLELIDSEIARKSVKSDIGETSDGYHTFNELYEHRTALFATLCNIRSDISWKSMKHDDGTMYDRMFIAGIETPDGQYTYHCEMKYWYMFAMTKEIEKAPAYDGHQPSDYPRLLALSENSLYSQSVTYEDVQKHIETLKDIYPSKKEIGSGEYPDVADALDVAILALEAYQPWVTDDDVREAIEQCEYALEDEQLESDGEWSNATFSTTALRTILTALQQMNKEPQWISVKDRLPEKGKLVLCFDATFGVQIAKRWLWTNYKECWATNSAMPLERITHWMPLPEPPKES